jgi:hypothetical protein
MICLLGGQLDPDRSRLGPEIDPDADPGFLAFSHPLLGIFSGLWLATPFVCNSTKKYFSGFIRRFIK